MYRSRGGDQFRPDPTKFSCTHSSFTNDFAGSTIYKDPTRGSQIEFLKEMQMQNPSSQILRFAKLANEGIKIDDER
jgi:hypothetical protein